MASNTLAPAAKFPHAMNVVALRPDNRIRAMRDRAGVTIEQLANRTGIQLKLLHRFENEPDFPGFKFSHARTIAAALDCAASDLMADSDVPYRLSDFERQLLHRCRASK